MKKSKLVVLLLLILAVSAVLLSCNGKPGETEHTHTPGTYQLTEEPTGFETGTASTTCGTCGETYTVTVPALTDASVWLEKTVPATHKAAGSATYTSVYGTVTVVLPVLPHEFGAWTMDKEPTETETGSATRSCECGETENATVPVLTDTTVWTEKTVPATHKETGSVTYTSEYGTVTVVLPVIPHTFGDWTMTVIATRTETGTATRTCGCGETETVTVPVLTDTSVWTVLTVDATHATPGKETYTSVYGIVTVDIPMILHTFGDWTLTVAPTGTETGSATHTCVCGATETVTVPVLTDTSVWSVETVPATHKETGSVTYTSVYGTVTVTLPVVPHEFGDWTLSVVPTVNEPGSATRTCACGETETATVPALTDGTVWVSEVIETHGEYSQLVRYTSVYGTVTVEVFLDGHDYGDWELTKNPTEDQTGKAIRHCKDCEHIWEIEVPALSDTSVWTVERVEATYTEAGSATYTSVYGSFTVEIPKLTLPYVGKTYADYELNASVYFRTGSLLTVGENGSGNASSYPFRDVTSFELTDPATGKLRVTITSGISVEYVGYVNPVTGTIVVFSGKDDIYLWVVADSRQDQSSVVNSLWENGNRTVSYTVGGETESIFVRDGVVYFNVTFADAEGNPIGAQDCNTAEKLYIRTASGEQIAAYGYDGKTLHELDGLEGTYRNGDETLTLSGYGTLTYGGFDGTYALLDDGVTLAVFTHDGDGRINAYYEVTLDGDTFTAEKPMVTVSFDAGAYATVEPVQVNRNVPFALPVLTSDDMLLSGWIYGETNVGLTFTPVGDTTLTAVWAKKVTIRLIGVPDGDDTELILAAGARLGDKLPEYDRDPSGHYRFNGWYVDMNGNGILDAEDEPLNEDVILSEEDSGATLIASWEAVKEYVGTYYGAEFWQQYGSSSQKYYLTINEDGTMSSNMETGGRVSLDGGTVIAYDPATQTVTWRSADGKQNVFFFDPDSGVIAGIVYQYIDRGFFILSSALTEDEWKPEVHTGVLADPIVTANDKKGYYAHFVTIRTKNGTETLFLYDNHIYSGVTIGTADGDELDVKQIRDAKTIVVYGADGKTVLFSAGTTAVNLGKASADDMVALDRYYGVYRNGSEILKLDGVGGFTYGDRTGTYRLEADVSYDLGAFTSDGKTYFRFALDTEEKTFSVTTPTAVIWFETAYGTKPKTIITNMNIAVALDMTLTDATHTFRGWYVRGDASKTLVDANFAPTGDVTLVALWDTTYTVTLVRNNGSADEVLSFGEGDLLTIDSPRYRGYQFLGWYTTSSFAEGTEWTSGVERIHANVTLYAKWGPAPAYAHIYLPIEFFGENENGGVHNGSAQNGYMFEIDPDGTGSKLGDKWMFPFPYGLTVKNYDPVSGSFLIYSAEWYTPSSGGDSGWYDDGDEGWGETESETDAEPVLREKFVYVRVDTATGVLFLVRSNADTATDPKLTNLNKYDVFLMVPLTEGAESASDCTSSGSYWNSGLTRAMSYTYGGKTYNAFLYNGEIYFDVRFADMMGNELTADRCSTAPTLYVYDRDGKLITSCGYNGTTMVPFDGMEGTYTGDGTILLNGVSTIEMGDFTGVYRKAPAGSAYTLDVYMNENGKIVYYRVTLDRSTMTFTKESPIVRITFESEYGDVPSPADVNPYVTFPLDMSLNDTDHVFRGWYVKGDETMTPVGSEFTPTEDTTLVAIWKKKVTLTVVYGNGLENGVFEYGENEVADPTVIWFANGQYFLTWQIKAGPFLRTYVPGPLTSDTTIQAKWTTEKPLEITNDSKFPYLTEWREDGSFFLKSTNQGQPDTHPGATIKFTRSVTMTVSWTVSSEKGFDKFSLYINGEIVGEQMSGEVSGSLTVTFNAGDTIYLSYSKDNLTDALDDTVTLTLSFD